jgi:Na+/melibiose symporter-like transporter
MEEAIRITDPVEPALLGTAAVPTEKARFSRDATLVGMGWLGTGLALGVSGLPFTFLLRDSLHLSPDVLAGFMAVANIPIYIKPVAGILSDAVPLFGTRRRHYLVLSLLLAGLFWVLLALVPRTFQTLLYTYLALNLFLVMTSTVLGGLMVEVGKRDGATGRLSAQRHGINQMVGLVAGPLSGFLATQAFIFTGLIAGVLNLALAPLFWLSLREPRGAKVNTDALRDVGLQIKTLFRSRMLWCAAGLVILVVAAPGFNIPLLYYQTDVLNFDRQFIGSLGVVKGLCGMVAAYLYMVFCRRMNLRSILAVSILIHSLLTLLYMFYRDQNSAIILTGIESMTMVFALLPLYDLAARATPSGSEALGYSLMMSVWNFTQSMSDLGGSWLYSHWGMSFNQLIWVNSGTTALVLLAVPFLPRMLVDRRDGDGGKQ